MRRSARSDLAHLEALRFDRGGRVLPQIRLYLQRENVPALARLLAADSGLFVLALAHAALGLNTPAQPTYARGAGAP